MIAFLETLREFGVAPFHHLPRLVAFLDARLHVRLRRGSRGERAFQRRTAFVRHAPRVVAFLETLVRHAPRVIAFLETLVHLGVPTSHLLEERVSFPDAFGQLAIASFEMCRRLVAFRRERLRRLRRALQLLARGVEVRLSFVRHAPRVVAFLETLCERRVALF